jgi:hypothetical protein
MCKLSVFDERDTGQALVEIGQAIMAGRHPVTGTIAVPFQERASMKISFDLSGPSGKMFEFDMKYHNLPPEYALEIASTARAFLNFINNTAGDAAGQDRSYSVSFSYDAEGKAPKVPEYEELFKGKTRKDSLLYSQAAGLQNAGIELMTKLMQGAEMEIKSGQRK